jgi:hypothetical protein
MIVNTLYCSGVSAFGAVADIGFVLVGFGGGFFSIELRLRLLLER